MKNNITRAAIAVLLILFSATALFSEADESTLLINFSTGDFQLDPAHSYTTTEAQLYSAIYEGLVSPHPLTLEPMPGAASRWVISPDGRTYTFFLRPEGKYWNGETVTSTDFAAAWFRLINPEENAEYSFMLDIIEGAYEYRTGQTSNMEDVGIRVISPLIFEVKLKEPAEYFLKLICHHTFSPVNPLNLDEGRWKHGPSAVGNGPFYLYSRTEELAVFRKNLLYWDAERVKLDAIHIQFSDSAETNTERFNSGEIHWAPTGIYLGALERSENLVTNPLFGTTYFYFTAFDEALADPDVRRGLSLILPWDRIRNTQNFFLPSDTLVPSIPGYPDLEGINKRDMQQALQLLHKAGYTKGRGINPIKIRIPESRDSMFVAATMKSEWEKFLDIEVEIEVFPFEDYFDSLKKSDYSMGTTSWIGDYADPLTFLQMWTAGSNLNDSGFNDPLYDALLNKAVKEKDTETRYELMAEAEGRLINGALVLPIENYPAFNAVNTDILQGWYPNVLDIHPFKYMYLLKPELPRGVVEAPSDLHLSSY
ncbi:MAG: peptide ABC transporter substrate-binding protein [Spirochaetales bacterium]|uniref:Peptide ABC transporter substrate-binding protein n=1 Tax=Candidatus Thalassospirochaeta sargassi TaxID=3119039 RepID=A0AAJ1II58_9SPIO|nr:peptide ABC transporter substrate-binding protein [Spirochaetales bacterium]